MKCINKKVRDHICCFKCFLLVGGSCSFIKQRMIFPEMTDRQNKIIFIIHCNRSKIDDNNSTPALGAVLVIWLFMHHIVLSV